jgi:hypothetical protein
MRPIITAAAAWLFAGASAIHAQEIDLSRAQLEPVQVTTSVEKLMGRDVVKGVKDPQVREFDEATFARIRGLESTCREARRGSS